MASQKRPVAMVTGGTRGIGSGEVGLNSGILLPKLFWPTVRKNCSSDQVKLLKSEAEDPLRSLEQFIQTVKGNRMLF